VTRSHAPGAALLHPVTLAALFTLALNDHVLKQVCPGWWTGKLSDFAGVVLLPVFLHALLELAAARVGRKPLSVATGDRWLLVCVVVSLLAFALPEVWKPAELAYRYGLGGARWPFRALAALLSGHELPSVRPVRATADVTDLLALPMGLVAFAVGRAQPATSDRTDERAFPPPRSSRRGSVPEALRASSHLAPLPPGQQRSALQLDPNLCDSHRLACGARPTDEDVRRPMA
jgi:hypothetical protein